MGIVNDRRPRDWAYIATFDSKHLPSLQQMIKQIQETHNTDLIEDFNDRCERHIKGEKDPQFENVVKTEDLLVNGGIQQCINIILGTSSIRFQYLELGTGTTAPTTSDTILQTVAAGGRIDMNAAGRGWRESVGMKLFFGAIGNEQAPTLTYTELGVFNASSGGTMLNREVFANLGVGHVSPNRASIFSSVIEFCPVA